MTWKDKLKNKQIWMSLIPAFLLLLQVVAGLFSFKLEFSDIGNKLYALVNAIFVILTILGIVSDTPTNKLQDTTKDFIDEIDNQNDK